MSLRRRSARRSQHQSRCDDSGDLANHIVLLILILKVVDPVKQSDRSERLPLLQFRMCAGRAFSVSRKSQKDYSSDLNNPLNPRHVRAENISFLDYRPGAAGLGVSPLMLSG
jgi:hypothetical protein